MEHSLTIPRPHVYACVYTCHMHVTCYIHMMTFALHSEHPGQLSTSQTQVWRWRTCKQNSISLMSCDVLTLLAIYSPPPHTHLPPSVFADISIRSAVCWMDWQRKLFWPPSLNGRSEYTLLCITCMQTCRVAGGSTTASTCNIYFN